MRKLSFLLVLLLLTAMQVLAQRTITGKVTSADDGNGIPGVTVLVMGTTTGVLTDIDGKYSISVPKIATALQYTFIGMTKQEITLTASDVVDVVMQSEATNIEGVIVTALGITRERKSLGYSVQDVKASELTKSNNADVVNSLQGKVAGVQVISSGGTAGASSYITIRGAHSLTGNNQPLFVIDGVPSISGGGGTTDVGGVASSGRSIEFNPDDMETMTVLKGGAATALYGLQAANGAIIITTKKGSAKTRMQVNLHQSFSIDKISQMPAMQKIFTQGFGGKWVSGQSASWGQRIDTSRYDNSNITVPGSYKWDANGKIVGMSNPTATDRLVNTYDQKDFFQTGGTTNTALSVSGGSENTTYYFSVGNLSQKGVVPNNTFGRTSFKVNAETKLTPKLKTGTSMNYIDSRGNFIQQGSNVSGVMLGLLRTPPTFDNAAGYRFPDGTQRNYRNGAGYDNPFWTANMNSYKDNISRFIGNVYLNYQPLTWLTFNYKIGTDTYTEKINNRMAIYSRANPAGFDNEYYSQSRIINSDFFLNATKSLFDNFTASLTLGQNMFSSYDNNLSATANGLSIPEFYQLSNTGNITGYNTTSEYRTAAVFGDLSLDYMSMLYLGITGRNEWSTTMPENNLSAFYPSVSAGFIFTELPGLKNNSVLSFGKLRASWAKTANIAGAYNTVDYYFQSTAGDGWTEGITFPFNNATGYTVGNGLGNSDLKHETQVSKEIGVELKFLSNRISLDFSLFDNLNKDLLLDVPIAASSGFTTSYMNAAEMESKGYEIVLGLIPVKTNSFEWDINANFSKTTNTVNSLAEGVENLFLGGFVDPQIRAVAGMEYRTIYGYDWYRDSNGTPIIYDGSDANFDWPVGTPILDGREMLPLGKVNPDWIANVTNTLTYKGLSLSALLDIKHGGLMYNGTQYAMNYFGTSEKTASREATYNTDGTLDLTKTPAENIIVYPGVMGHIDADGNPVATTTQNTTQVVNGQDWYRYYGGSNFAQGPTSAAMQDAGWIRLREITLSYRLDSKTIGKSFLKGVEIYATGRNLWLSTKYEGIDPETNLQGASNSQGMDYFNMPGSKSYVFGFKIDI